MQAFSNNLRGMAHFSNSQPENCWSHSSDPGERLQQGRFEVDSFPRLVNMIGGAETSHQFAMGAQRIWIIFMPEASFSSEMLSVHCASTQSNSASRRIGTFKKRVGQLCVRSACSVSS